MTMYLFGLYLWIFMLYSFTDEGIYYNIQMNIFQLFTYHSFDWAHSAVFFFFFTLSKSVRSHEEKYQATLALNGQFCFILFLYRSGISAFPYMGISETWRRGLVLFGEARRGAAN